MPLFWSVERDRDAVVAICPEPLRAPGSTRPAWMTGCAEAIRDELRLLPAVPGTLLAATPLIAGALVYCDKPTPRTTTRELLPAGMP